MSLTYELYLLGGAGQFCKLQCQVDLFQLVIVTVDPILQHSTVCIEPFSEVLIYISELCYEFSLFISNS